jgi:hypothetical protein
MGKPSRQRTMKNTRAVAPVDVPQAALLPGRGLVPIGPFDQRVHAHALHRHARVAAAQRGGRDVVEPRRPAVPHVAGLGDEQRPFVAPVHLGEDVGRVAPARLAQVPVQPRVARVLPLVAVVIVEAQHVEVARCAAQRRLGAAAQHVPRLVLLGHQRGGLRLERLVAGLGGHHVNHGVGVHDARVRADAPECIAAAQCRMHQPALQVEAARGGIGLEGMDQRGAGGCPAQERDLVDRLEDGRAVGFVLQRAGYLFAPRGEAAGEAGCEHVHAGGHAVVVQRPDHLQPVPPRGTGCVHQALQAAGLGFEGTPADALAHGQQAQGGGGGVVLVDPLPVPVAPVHCQRHAVAVHMVGTFVATHPERAKERRLAVAMRFRAADRGRGGGLQSLLS